MEEAEGFQDLSFAEILGRYYHSQHYLEMYHDLILLLMDASVSVDIDALIKRGENQLKDSQLKEMFPMGKGSHRKYLPVN